MPQAAQVTQATGHDNTIICDKHSEVISTANSVDKSKQNVCWVTVFWLKLDWNPLIS